MTKGAKIFVLRKALNECRDVHLNCEDSWYSCPKSTDGCSDDRQGPECNCGVEDRNNMIDFVLKETE
jgi:hypothetical protein